MTGRRMALMALVALVVTGPARAELACAEAVHSAGRVNSGTSLRHAFTLVNRGKAAVELLEVKPACGCLRPEVSAATAGPGEPITLTVHINTVTQPAGPNTWRTRVSYRAGGEPRELELAVRADVVPVVQIQPATVVLHAAGPISHQFKLLDRREKPFQAKQLVCGSPHVQAKLGPPRRAGDVWERTITLNVRAGCPEGRHDDVLRVLTADAEYPELQVPFTVVMRVPGKVQASPPALEITAPAGEPIPAKIVLLGCDEGEVRATKVETSDPLIQCKYAAGPGARLTLRVVVDHARLAKGDFHGEVKVHVGGDRPQVVTIPVRVRR